MRGGNKEESFFFPSLRRKKASLSLSPSLSSSLYLSSLVWFKNAWEVPVRTASTTSKLLGRERKNERERKREREKKREKEGKRDDKVEQRGVGLNGNGLLKVKYVQKSVFFLFCEFDLPRNTYCRSFERFQVCVHLVPYRSKFWISPFLFPMLLVYLLIIPLSTF